MMPEGYKNKNIRELIELRKQKIKIMLSNEEFLSTKEEKEEIEELGKYIAEREKKEDRDFEEHMKKRKDNNR